MNFKDIGQKIGLFCKQHSPEILVTTGIGEMVTGAVLACRATRKLDDVLEKFNAEMMHLADIYDVALSRDLPPEEHKDILKEYRKRMRSCYFHAAMALAKLYGLSIGFGAGGIVSILCGTGILKKRNAALAAAYTALDSSYREYRRRVAEKYGEEAENDIYYGEGRVKVDVTEIDEKGKEKKTKVDEQVVREGLCSPYARYFTANDTLAAEINFDYNEMFLNDMQEQFNRMLKSRKFLYLNDLYEQLGYDRCVAGQEVGWVYDSKHPEGDNYIDLRIHVVKRMRDDGTFERIHVIDPNVDGPITDHLVRLKLIGK